MNVLLVLKIIQNAGSGKVIPFLVCEKQIGLIMHKECKSGYPCCVQNR